MDVNSDLINQKWHEKLFGLKLVKCSLNNDDDNNDDKIDNKRKLNDFINVKTIDVLENCQIVGVYFSFANINLQSDELIKKLRNLYERLNDNNSDKGDLKKLEIIQIVLWAHNDVYSDFENSHKDNLSGLPWYAVPYNEIDLKTKLSRRFRIKSGVPTLVLLDRDGSTVSVSAQDRLFEDPLGLEFPWRPRPVDQVLKDIVLQKGGHYDKEHQKQQQQSSNDITYKDLPDGVKGFYFSANWCPPCRAFTPQLAEVYSLIRKREPNFEVIFISSDRSQESYGAYIETMPWLCIPWQQTGIRAELAQLYGIRGIPTLLLLDRNGHIITTDGRAELAEDPLAQNFPWKPRPVNILTERYLNKLHDYPAIVLFVDGEETELQFAESVLTPIAETYYQKYNINFNTITTDDYYLNAEHYLQFLICIEPTDTSDLLRDLIGLDDLIPLLIGIDLTNHKYAIMEYGIEITIDTVNDFVQSFQTGQNIKYFNINDRRHDNDNNDDGNQDHDDDDDDDNKD